MHVETHDVCVWLNVQSTDHSAFRDLNLDSFIVSEYWTAVRRRVCVHWYESACEIRQVERIKRLLSLLTLAERRAGREITALDKQGRSWQRFDSRRKFSSFLHVSSARKT